MTGACDRDWLRYRRSSEGSKPFEGFAVLAQLIEAKGNMADLLEEIEEQIVGTKVTAARQNVGVIREVGDGVARVEGLSDVMLNEMLDLGHGITGLALDLDETEVGVVVLGDYTRLAEGDEVGATGKLLQVPVGKGL